MTDPDWSALPALQRGMLELYTQGRSYEEIAAQYDLPAWCAEAYVKPHLNTSVRQKHNHSRFGPPEPKTATVRRSSRVSTKGCDIEAMVGMYAQGYVYRQIAERFGVSMAQISTLIAGRLTKEVLADHNQNYRGKSRGKSSAINTPENVAVMLDLYAQGYVYRQIAERFGCKPQYVCSLISAALTTQKRAEHKKNYRGKSPGRRAKLPV